MWLGGALSERVRAWDAERHSKKLGFVVVVKLEKQTPGLQPEGPVIDAWRAAGVGIGAKAHRRVFGGRSAGDDISRHQVDLFPVLNHHLRMFVSRAFSLACVSELFHTGVLLVAVCNGN